MNTIIDRIRTIRLEIPENSSLMNLFSQLSNFLYKDGTLVSNLPYLSPQSIISLSSISAPRLSFITDSHQKIQILQAGNLTIGFNLDTEFQIRTENKQIQEIYLGNEKVVLIDIERVIRALIRSNMTLNHFGINFGPTLTKEPEYKLFRKNLANRSNLYSYPTGEEWPFLLPSTDEEFIQEIQDAAVYRNPKFELVYSKYHPDPLIQFDIETQLNRKEVEQLFPPPFGVSLQGLENMFRSVFVKTNWHGVLLRIDLRFAHDNIDFGSWILKKGKRIK